MGNIKLIDMEHYFMTRAFMLNSIQMQKSNTRDNYRDKNSPESGQSFILYFFIFALILGWSFIGYNFGEFIGLGAGLFFALLVSGYALTIEEGK